MAGKRMFSVAMVLAGLCGAGRAEGLFFSDKGAAGAPYQRALLMYEGGRETLIMQSKFELPTGTNGGRLVWVVPVPATPEVASMDMHVAQSLFLRLGWDTRPKMVAVGPTLLIFILFLLWVASAVCLLIVLLARKTQLALRIQDFARRRRSVWILVVLLLAVLTIVVFTLPVGGSVHGLDIADVPTARVQDVMVIRSETGDEAVKWLRRNGFSCTPADEAVLGDYAKERWSFVVATLDTGSGTEPSKVVMTGLTPPLVIRFETAEAVYPAAMDSPGAEVALYVLAEHKMDCPGVLKASYAQGQYAIQPQRWYVRPEGFFALAGTEAKFLTKLKGKPEIGSARRQDIVVKPAPDDAACREEKLVLW